MYRAMPLEPISLKLDTVFNIFIVSLSCAYLVHAGQRHCAKFQPSKNNSRQQEKSGKNNNFHRLFGKGGSNSKVSEQKPFINSWTLPEAKTLCLLGGPFLDAHLVICTSHFYGKEIGPKASCDGSHACPMPVGGFSNICQPLS